MGVRGDPGREDEKSSSSPEYVSLQQRLVPAFPGDTAHSFLLFFLQRAFCFCCPEPGVINYRGKCAIMIPDAPGSS